jgi:hypothetical protein
MFQKTNLFPTTLYSLTIDPNHYDKSNIVKTAIQNYKIKPLRNSWSEDSVLHHYYKDWNNSDFIKIDLSSLLPVYKTLFDDFLLNFNFKKKVQYSFKIVNLTVFKGDEGNMVSHHHTGDGRAFFSAVHYLSVGKNNKKLIFQNPLIFGQYLNNFYETFYENVISNDCLSLSAFSPSCEYIPKDDHMIIFPSYLKHEVGDTVNTSNDFRIAVIINFYLDINEAGMM